MDYFSLGSEISYPNYNALVYLLRKFKRLTSDLKLGNNVISSDYGTYSVTGGLTSVGGNFILEDDVTITSSDVLLNCFYTFYFTVVDVNLSGTVNRRVVSVTGDTGDDGVLEVVLEPSLLESDEVILPDFKVDIVFDEHEYYTPVSALDITLTVDKSYITVGESNTVTATVLDDSGEPVSGLDLQFSFNGVIVSDTTDSDGIASAEYTGTGAGWVNVLVNGKSIQFYDGSVLIAEVTGNSITLGGLEGHFWLSSVGEVIIDWGDGTTDTVNNPYSLLTHNYADGITNHNIVFVGEVTGFNQCFYMCTNLTTISIPNSVTRLLSNTFQGCTGLTSVSIPSSVTSIDFYGFKDCTSLTTVSIPDSVTSLGSYCFYGCSSLIDYQLYWTGNDIITYDSGKMPNNTNTVFTIPYGQTSNYIAKGYPSSKLVERSAPVHTYSLSIASDKSSILTSESVTISGTLLMDSSGYSGQSVALYDGSTLIDILTTDSNGEYSKTLTGLTAGTHSFKAVNTNAESSTVSVTVSEPTPVHNYSLSVTGTAIIQTGDNDIITATLKDNGVVVSGETLNYQIKHGSTVIASGSDTTDTNGEISFNYVGTGIGDIEVIISYGSLLQETFVLQDCWKYGIQSTDTWHNVKSPNTGTYNNGEYYGYNKILDFDWDISTDWEITVDYKKAEYRCGLIILDETMTTSYDTSRYAFLWEKSANRVILEAKNSSNTLVINSQITKTMNYNQYYNVKIVKQGTTVKTYVDDVEVHSVTYVDVGINTANIGMFTWENRVGYMKNLKIKAL